MLKMTLLHRPRLIVAPALAAMLFLSSCAPLPSQFSAGSSSPLEPDGAVVQDGTGGEEGEVALQPYEEVVTADAVSQTGLFTTHQVGRHFYLEIPTRLLGQDMLWYVETGSVPMRLTSARRLGERMVRWVRHGNSLMLEDWSNSLLKRADKSAQQQPGSALGVSLVTLPNMVRAFPIRAEGGGETDAGTATPSASASSAPVSSVVIEITEDFASDFTEASPYTALVGVNYDISAEVDSDRSYISEVRAFPNNVLIRNLLTFRANPGTTMGSASIELRHQFILLPATPMQPRYADRRVGYFSVGFEDYSYGETNKVELRDLIHRARLEKRDPTAAVSEPVTPIVFYLSPDVPAKWRDDIRRGVETWQPVLEAAGFKNAIVAKDAPSADWDPFDVRYSIIHWEYSAAAFGEAAPVVDPRTGEILFSRIYLTGNILDAESYAYFAQVAALDARARKLPLPDELLGQLLQAIVSHEVGHTLGLAHNFKASQAYAVAELRNPAFVRENGIAASIMSYSAYNYVAQPEDGVSLADLIPRIGPYDYFAIRWGYTPIAAATTPAEEKPVLDGWAAEQVKNPWLAYDGDIDFDFNNDINDPTVLAFNLGSDRIESTQLGLKNVERSLGYLLSATVQLGTDYDPLFNAYLTALGARMGLLYGASKMVGGVIETRALGGRTEAEFVPVPLAQQREALKFVLAAMQVPEAFVRPDVAYRLTSYDIVAPVRDQQRILLSMMLNGNKYRTLADLELTKPANAYALVDYLADMQAGIWSELEQTAPISPLRRALQRQYLDLIEGQMISLKVAAPENEVFNIYSDWEVYDTDFRAAARMNLRQLLKRLNDALLGTTDHTTQAHLEDARDQIERMLKL